MTQPTHLYEGYREWKRWDTDLFGCYSPDQARYFMHELNYSGIGKINGARVLEIGFGNGAFAAWAHGSGALWTGVEEIPHLIQEAEQHGWSAYPANNLDILNKKAPFNLVVAFDVFEHIEIEDLCKLLRQIRCMLSPGGLLIARVPSGDSPFARAIQNGDITHRSHIGSSAVYQIANKCDFQVVQVREPAYPLRGLGLKSTFKRGLVMSVRAVVFPIIKLAIMGNSQAVLTPNLVFVLKREN